MASIGQGKKVGRPLDVIMAEERHVNDMFGDYVVFMMHNICLYVHRAE